MATDQQPEQIHSRVSGLMRRLTVLATLLAAAFGIAAQTERDARIDCSYDPAEIRECQEEKARASESELRRARDFVRQQLSRWDEDAKYVKAARERLAAADKSFADYRARQCAFAASTAGGAIGNAHETMRQACLFQLNTQRAAELRSVMDNLPLR